MNEQIPKYDQQPQALEQKVIALQYENLADVLNSQEVAEYLDLHVKTIREYIKDGRIRAVKMGKYYRIRKEWVIDFLDQSSQIYN